MAMFLAKLKTGGGGILHAKSDDVLLQGEVECPQITNLGCPLFANAIAQLSCSPHG